MSWVLILYMLTSDSTPVQVSIGFQSQEACLDNKEPVTSKVRFYAKWAGATVINSECKGTTS